MIPFFTKRKRYGVIDEDALRTSFHALRKNAHFQTFIEHLHERREQAIRNMQTERVIECSNRHFMESGKLEAIDELLDDMELWAGSKLD